MIKIYLTRHGQTEWNKLGKMQGQNDSPLTADGILKARELGKKIKHINFDKIYTSPLSRAYDTAQYINESINCDVINDDRLKEMYLSDFEGQTLDSFKKNYSDDYHKFWYKPHEYMQIYNEETFENMIKRSKSFLDDIIKRHDNQTILVVSHGLILKAVFLAMIDGDIKDLFEGEPLKGTSISYVEYDGKFNIKYKSDNSFVGGN